MAHYVEIEEARELPGLRLVLTAGVPGPWGEGAKYLFDYKGIPYTKVRQTPGKSDEALRAWTAQSSAPVAVLDEERPRSSWVEILYLAERMAPEPALIPEAASARVAMFGLLHEICGDQGYGWQRRLMMLRPTIEAGGEPFSKGFARKYGYSPDAAAAAPARCVEILRGLSQQLRSQTERGSRYLIGETLSALDLYWAAFSQMLEPLPPEQSPAPKRLRATYTETDPEVRSAADPGLLEHRDFIFREHVGLPLDF